MRPGISPDTLQFYCYRSNPMCGPQGVPCADCRGFSAENVGRVNRAGVACVPGRGLCSQRLYCGQPSGEGLCGPDAGPQCEACVGLGATGPITRRNAAGRHCARTPDNPRFYCGAPANGTYCVAEGVQCADCASISAGDAPPAAVDVSPAEPPAPQVDPPAPQAVAPAASPDECAVCFEPLAVRVAIVPCGHTQTCKSCLETLSKCPLCSGPCQQVLRLY